MAYSALNISVLLINLDQSTDRLQFQQHQLARLGLAMQRLPAVQAVDITAEEYEQCANGWERKMRKAEVACFLSHKQAWHIVLEYNQPLLILEDDALLSHQLPCILKTLASRNDLDYINLETRQRRKLLGRQEIKLTDDYGMRRLYQDRNGSAAYVLFPSGARKLLARAQRQSPALADAFLSRAYDLYGWQIFPAAAIQTDQCTAYQLERVNPFTSTITSTNQAKPQANNILDYCRFKYRRIAAQCRMGWRQCSLWGRAQRLYVPVRDADF